MSKLADILIGQIAGPAPSIRDLAADLRDRFGSGRKAAKAMGVNESTFRRILSGKTHAPKSTTAQSMREAQVRAKGATSAALKLAFTFDGRDRALGATNLKLASGTVESMGAAYARGDREGVARAFIDGVGDGWYHDRIEEVYEGHDGGDYGADYKAA